MYVKSLQKMAQSMMNVIQFIQKKIVRTRIRLGHQDEMSQTRIFSAIYQDFSKIASGRSAISPRALEKIYKEPGKKLQKADFFRNDTWVCLDSKYQNPQKSPWRHFFKFELNLAAILDFDVFKKIVKHSIFGTKASVTPLDICFWGQRIHF